MNTRATFWLLAVAALLALLLWLRGERDETRPDEASLVFGTLLADEIQSIELDTSDGHRARLLRQASGWRLAAPVAAPADALVADGIAAALASLEAESVFEEIEALENYGLEGQPQIVFETAAASFALRIGKRAPVGSAQYLSDAPATRVFLVPAYRTSALQRKLDELRDARLLVFDADAVVGLHASWPAGEVSLERNASGWRLTQPVEAPADSARIEQLLGTLARQRASGFIDAPVERVENSNELGLVTPDFALELQVEEKNEGAPLRFVLGAERDGKRVARARDDQLFEVSATLLSSLPRDLFSYRQRELARFDPEEVASLEWSFARADAEGAPLQLHMQRDEAGDWQTTPAAFPQDALTALLGELSTLDASAVLLEQATKEQGARLGLSPPRTRLRVFADADAAAAALAELRFGAPIEARGIPVQRADLDTVFLAPAELARHLPLGAEDFEQNFRPKPPPLTAPTSE